MSTRIQRVRDAPSHPKWKDFEPELWEVLSEDLREQEFTGSFEECVQYLKGLCPTGGCE